jgi:hypothetical protein
MYLFCNSRIHVITLYSGHVCVYYASMLRCWHLVWILVRTDHPYLGVGCHRPHQHSLRMLTMSSAFLSIIDVKQFLTVIQPVLPLHDCADPAPVESATEPLQSVAESAAEPLQADSVAALIETYCS